MGQFSWLDCVTGEQILDDYPRDVYVLVPQEFGGGHIVESYYEGYGDFGGHDIYDLVADWNKKTMTIGNLEGIEPSGWDYDGGEKYYLAAVNRYGEKVNRFIDFKNGMSDKKMKEQYGDNYKRMIGIDIACYDKQNAALKYHIKITYDKNAIYENCEPSLSDPNQGWPVHQLDL